jgi:hypothetical protein
MKTFRALDFGIVEDAHADDEEENSAPATG